METFGKTTHHALAASLVPVILTVTTTTAMMGLQKAGLSHTRRASWACVLRTVVRYSLPHAGNGPEVYRHLARLENRSEPGAVLPSHASLSSLLVQSGPPNLLLPQLGKT